MKEKFKRVLCMVMAFAFALSLMTVPAFAETVTVQFGGTTVTESSADQTVDLTVSATSAFSWCSYGFIASIDSPLAITGLKNESGGSIWSEYNDSTGELTHYYDAVNLTDTTSADLVTVTVTIPANTPAGTYTVTLTDFIVMADYGNDIPVDTNLTATITVSTSAPATQGYELYYTLNNSTDSDSDHFIEYNPGDTVTATVYLKSNLADTLQAFDLYVTNDANLTFMGYTSTYGTRIASGTAASTATSQHIQAVGADKNNPINEPLPAGTGVAIATLTFTVADAAVYNTGMPITITADSNIAVANTPASFTPDRQTVSNDVLGAETLKQYTVTYDENKPAAAASLTVTDMPSPLIADKGHNVAHTVADAPSLTNYTFAGWNTAADGSGDSYAAGGSYTANADVTLYAQWTPDTHSVTWKSQDGSNTLETDAAVAYGATLSYDGAAPTKDDPSGQYTYTFEGWNANPDQETGAAANTFTMGDADMVLYAAFSKITNNYTVTWKSQDGNTTYETDTDVPYGTAPSFDQADPTKASDATYNYIFDGWAEAANAESGTLEANLPTVDGDETYYAAFRKTYIDYTVEFALGDHPASGETPPASQTAHNGDTITLPAGPAAADGYTFTGWSDGTNTYDAGDPYVISGAGATMTAQYAEKTYTVAYDANTGSGTAPASHTGLAYTADFVVAANTFTAPVGYKFNGWNTAANGSGVSANVGETYKLSTMGLDSTTLAGDTITLYAQWTLDSNWTITYTGDTGATYATANPTEYNVLTAAFTLTNPTKTGYTFKGWSGTGLTGDTNTSVTVTPGTAPWTQNLTFTANWTPAEVNYTVNHYQENLDGTYPATPTETETKQGYTESDTAAVAKSYEHFTAGHTDGDAVGTITQVEISADGSTVVNIYYERETYTVTYSFTGNVPSGVTAPVDASSPYKYGATVTVENAPTAVAGYTFGGWKISGSDAGTSFVIDANTTITGNWTLNTYHIYFEDDQGNLVTDGDQTFDAEHKTITVPAVPAKTADAAWYDAGTWGTYSTNTLADQHVQPVYNELTFTVTYQDEDGNTYTSTDQEYTKSDPTVTKPGTVPTKPGYTVTWPDPDTTTPGSKTVTATYTPIDYTITFVLDGGTDIAVDATNGITAVNTMTYNIESTWTLPTASGKANFSFVNWKVTATDTEAKWASNSTINGGTAVTGKYGNVTLTAQWTQNLHYEVQEYKYAPADYKLLIIDAANVGAGNVYTYDGATMYYTEDANYQIGTGATASTGVFYTLIPATALTLTDEQVGKIAAVAGTAATITYDGDINGDGVVNIADANAIFQMVVATGSYYSETQLTIAQRLAADMIKGTDNAEHRGSIEDVNEVVAIINGTKQ